MVSVGVGGDETEGPVGVNAGGVAPAAEGGALELEEVAVVAEALGAALLRARRLAAGGGGALKGGGRWKAAAVRREPGDGMSGAHPDRRDPQILSTVLSSMVVSQGWEQKLTVGSISVRWEELVGGPIAQNTRPESYEDGVLHVRARSTTWATQLRWMADEMVQKLNAGLGEGTVERVTVQGPAAPSWAKGRYRVKGPGPRDTYG